MKEELLSLISVNRDAIATNRGFYYQYLHVVLKWINKFLDDDPTDVLTEVDDDIKEVGDRIVFTQLKCYTSAFSFNSPEIQKALLNFYYLYLKNRDEVSELGFNFITNTSVNRNEKLLNRWVAEQPVATDELKNLCTTKVSGIIQKGVNKIRDKRINNTNLSQDDKLKLRGDFDELGSIVRDNHLMADFIGRVTWKFEDLLPDQSIEDLHKQIIGQLANPKFYARPVKLLLEAMLSEIYRRSQLSDPQHRCVNNTDLKLLLEAKDEELNTYIDKRLIDLLDMRISLIENSLNELKDVVTETAFTQKQQGEILEKLLQDGAKEKHVVPRLITRIPFFNATEVIGRKAVLTELHKSLSANRQVAVIGTGGMGKSTMLKYYLNTCQNEYDHIIWINAESGLVNSISLNAEIARALSLPVESDKFAQRFSQVLLNLQNLNGNNLIVIDDYRTAVPELDEIRALSNWNVLIGTRLRMSKWHTITIDALTFDEAKNLYTSIVTTDMTEDEQLQAFFEAVEYNTLMIGLVAKTIHHSLDLTLSKVMDCIEAQDLDNVELEIDLPDEVGASPRLINILKATFDLGALDPHEQYYMMFFAQLPSEDTDIQDLVDWYGTRKLADNKRELTNVINNLHSRGLIERNGGHFHMHRMLQQAIFYQERQSERPFQSQFMHIPELTSRIHEGADNNINKALRFLKYGESYLTNIKENYRGSIYLAMLQLENEVLHIYNWLYTQNDMVAKWDNLYKRAQAFLPDTHSLIGVIANNYGLALVTAGNMEKAIPLFDKASITMEAQNDNAISQQLISLSNLCHLFVQRNDMERYMEYFNKIQEIRKKHKLYDDISLPIQSGVMGIANKKLGNFESAIQTFNLAINLHLELPKEKRNDLHLINYLISITECYLQMKLIDKAEKSVIAAVNVLSKIQAQDTIYLREVTKLLIIISSIKGNQEEADRLRKALENMGYY